jgi:propionyl-CoA synthetase
MSSIFDAVYQKSLDDPNGFWGEAATGISWSRKPTRILDESQAPVYRWFSDGELNTCFNALDRHVRAGRGEATALIYDSAMTGEQRRYSYSELTELTARCAGAIQHLGVSKGDRVLIYMPMIAEAVVAMLACARIGAIHSVVFGGFAANELAKRIDDAAPRLVIAASCGLEPSRVVHYQPLLEEALGLSAHEVPKVLMVQRDAWQAPLRQGRDYDWSVEVPKAPMADCVSVAATDPLYILYTSGTTGQPKGVVRDNGGHAVALHWSMRHIYDVGEDEVFWAASDVGWVVGHSYIVYAPLLAGATTLMYEGKPVGTPDAGAFWRVIEQYNVKVLFTAPTAFRAIKKEDPKGELLLNYATDSLSALFLAGERTDPDTLHWAQQKLGVPVVDHWWQTETGWAICANCLGIQELPVKDGSPTKPTPGWNLCVLDEAGNPLPPGELGSLAVKLPLPPGAFPTLWNAPDRFIESYLAAFPGYYNTGDAGIIDDDGYAFILSRTDDIINVAGHRLSTGGMEEVLADHPDVAECAVLGIADAMKGEIPMGLVVLSAGVTRDHAEIVTELVQSVRDRIGPVAAFKLAAVVERLPKTRSGKILRATIRKMANGESVTVPATIDDPAILIEIRQVLDTLLRRG